MIAETTRRRMRETGLHGLSTQQLLATAAIGLAMLAAAGWWLLRHHQRSDVRKILQQHSPLANPPAELQFPAHAFGTEEVRNTWAAGATAGFWVIQKSHAGVLQLVLTSKGQQFFSAVGGNIVGGFAAGTREIKSVDGISDSGSTRTVKFRYVWSSIHPAMAICGDQIPQLNREYTGEAILVRNEMGWSLAYWTTPELDAAQQRFRQLGQERQQPR
jgi:hypothetical protein